MMDSAPAGAAGPRWRMSKMYGESHRTLQRRFDTERLADRIEERLVHDFIGAGGPRLHRAPGHVLPGHRRRAGPTELLVQGR